jgi:hypothetical protein
VLDIERFCSTYHIPILPEGHHHCHAGWMQLHCPFCGGADGWHLGFNLQWGNFNCWRCGSLKTLNVIGAFLKTNRKQDILDVLRKFQIRKQGEPLRERVERNDKLDPPVGMGPLTRLHRLYLRRRGFNPTALEQLWGLRATTHLSGEWNWRIVAPIRDQDGRVVAYQGRAIQTDVRPKYKMTDRDDALIDPSHLLYGLECAQKSVVIVEGVVDVWKIGPGAVATFGIDWKQEQANRLRCFNQRYVLFDPEPKAQQRALALAENLSLFGGVTEVIYGYDTDPGDFTNAQVRRLRTKLGLHSL